jgi:hypothetical protein
MRNLKEELKKKISEDMLTISLGYSKTQSYCGFILFDEIEMPQELITMEWE